MYVHVPRRQDTPFLGLALFPRLGFNNQPRKQAITLFLSLSYSFTRDISQHPKQCISLLSLSLYMHASLAPNHQPRQTTMHDSLFCAFNNPLFAVKCSIIWPRHADGVTGKQYLIKEE